MLELKNFFQEYKKVKQLGFGQYSFVWLYRKGKKQVAVKEMSYDYVDHIIKDIDNETEIMNKMKCKYIPRLLGYVIEGVHYFLVLEFVKGKNLVEYRKKYRFSKTYPYNLIKYLGQLAKAVECIHKLNIIHFDLNPNNMMITNKGAMVIDFGEAVSKKSETDTIINPNITIAPPYFKPNKHYTICQAKSFDLYSLCFTFFKSFEEIKIPDSHEIKQAIDLLNIVINAKKPFSKSEYNKILKKLTSLK